MTAGTASPRGVVGITERRKAAQAIDRLRVRLIDDAIDYCDRIDKTIERPDTPRDDGQALADVADTLPHLYRVLERLRAVGK